jgi:heme/copper-type cytochrome/quinol oxidase subunit 2
MQKNWLRPLGVGLLTILMMVIPVPYRKSQPTDRLIQIEASRFSFSPSIIRVNPGDRVKIAVKSVDVVHGLYLDQYGISVTADPGQTAVMEFTADRAGSFRFRCSVACGDMHPFMIGRLYVGPNLLLWRSAALFLLITIFVLLQNRFRWI